MIIGNKLIRATIGKYVSISKFKAEITANQQLSMGTVSTRTAEHGVMISQHYNQDTANEEAHLHYYLNGASIFRSDTGLLGVKWPGVQQGGFPQPFVGLYIPPESTLEVIVQHDNNPGSAAIDVYYSAVFYLFSDADAALPTPIEPECPEWLKEPPEWYVKALQNAARYSQGPQ